MRKRAERNCGEEAISIKPANESNEIDYIIWNEATLIPFLDAYAQQRVTRITRMLLGTKRICTLVHGIISIFLYIYSPCISLEIETMIKIVRKLQGY